MPSTSASAQCSFEANDVPLWNPPMTSLSACRGSSTAPSLPSFQPSPEERPRPTCDELIEKASPPVYNHTPRPPESMTLNRTHVPPQTQPELANKTSGRTARNKDNVEVWLLGHSSTPLNLHRQEFEDRTRGGVSA
ncbi:hypothetical protein BDV93DRAFT_520129 [Ceratobasidium sp. AG-I]|nr:hypothetical protein BDV93DRAFT_520129 [Ceratobasidium sp. AG-I]